jgi:hypothetical protein
MPARLLPLGFVVLSVSACGGHGSSPVPPTSPSSRPIPAAVPVTNVAISGPQVVLSGSSVTYSVTATFADGTMIHNAAPTTWRTDNGDVATISSAPDGIGELTGLGPGTTTITAIYQGMSATFAAQVRVMSEQKGGANLAISFTPDPVPASRMKCPNGFPAPTWSFTETITETQGVGFTQEMVTLVLYNDQGNVIYLATEPEKYYFPPNSVFVEDGCLFGAATGGFYSDSFEGVDDKGNRLAFASRLRLLPLAGVSPTSGQVSPIPIAPGTLLRTLHRIH